MIHNLILLKLLTRSSYLDDFFSIDNPYFAGMVTQIYPNELQLNKPYSIDSEVAFLDLH